MRKKLLKGVILLVFAIVLLTGVFYSCGFDEYIPEISSRLAKYHNTGEINVTIDGEKIPIDGTQIDFICDGDFVETTTSEEGSFKIKDGSYGENTFEFKIRETEFAPITVKFGHFNTSWWHVVNYKIDIDLLSDENGSYIVKTNGKISYKDKDYLVNIDENTCLINKENNVIDLRPKGLIE